MNGKIWLAGLALISLLGTTAISAQPERELGQRGLRIGGDRILVQSVADALGMTARELMPLVREGATLAEIVESNGGSVEAIIADAVADATERINQAVTNERLTQAQADELIANLETFFTDAIQESPRQQRAEFVVGAVVLRLAAEETGLTVREIVAAIREGSTLGAVLTAHDVDIDGFVDTVVAQAETRLEEAVANERITQERMDEMLNTLRNQLTERLNMSNPI